MKLFILHRAMESYRAMELHAHLTFSNSNNINCAWACQNSKLGGRQLEKGRKEGMEERREGRRKRGRERRRQEGGKGWRIE